MKMKWIMLTVCLALAGCKTVTVPVEEDVAVLEVPRPTALFPDYFLMDGFKLNDQGHIPGTGLIGGDMTVSQDLGAVRNLINEQLAIHEWTTDKMEIGRKYFRVLASHAGDEIEIRAVQGTGPTQVFVLYHPVPSRGEK